MLSASQPELKMMMNMETEKLVKLRTELDKELERISEDFISSHHLETESFLAHIKELKYGYQENIEEYGGHVLSNLGKS